MRNTPIWLYFFVEYFQSELNPFFNLPTTSGLSLNTEHTFICQNETATRWPYMERTS